MCSAWKKMKRYRSEDLTSCDSLLMLPFVFNMYNNEIPTHVPIVAIKPFETSFNPFCYVSKCFLKQSMFFPFTCLKQ
jgi:hypothetical protein